MNTDERCTVPTLPASSELSGKRSQSSAPARHSTRRNDMFRTRPTLLKRVIAKDEQSWADFYSIYTPLIRWRCQRLGLYDDYRQQLVVQAVMLHFSKAEWTYDADKGRFHWLLLTITSYKIHEIRRETRVAGSIPVLDNVPEASLSAETPAEENGEERNELVHLACYRLSQDPEINTLHMQILLMFIQGQRSPDIAAQTGISTAAIYLIKHRMIQRLQKVLRDMAE